MYEEYTQPYVNDYSQMANAIMYPSSAGQHLEKVKTVTRKATTPVIVNRDSLISTLAGVNNEYKQALDDANTFWGKLGKSVSDQQVRDALAAPTNKGRLESKMGWGQALSGALLSGLNTYGKFKAAEENKAAKDYEAALKQLTMEDSLMARKEAADLQNALNTQTIEVEGYEKLNGPTMASGSGTGAKAKQAQQEAVEKKIADAVDQESAAITMADVYHTVDQHPNQFSWVARNTSGVYPGGDLQRRHWVAQQAPVVGGVELQKLQKMMPNGFSGAINSAVEQKLMMPVREALASGSGSNIKAAITTILGGYYDQLQKEYIMKTQGQILPFTKEQFINDQLTINAREYNVDYDPVDPTKPMFLPIKGVNKTVAATPEDVIAQHGFKVIQQ